MPFPDLRSIREWSDQDHRKGRADLVTLNKKPMFGSLDKQQIEQVLHHQLVGRIGCHDNGLTYVVPISYAYDGNFIYGHTSEGMKIRIMRKNPNVCFQVDEMENMGNWKSVIA